MYRKAVQELVARKYPRQDLFTGLLSFDKTEYICSTCHKKVSKNQMPCQSVKNKLEVTELPSELKDLYKLETILIAQRICFQKIIIMPKGQQLKSKGSIIDIPVECDTTCSMLPRPPSASGILMLKLKRKLNYHGHVYFQSVRSAVIRQALSFLKAHNHLYDKIGIDLANIPADLLEERSSDSQNQKTDSTETDKHMDRFTALNHDVEAEGEDPLNKYRTQASETCLQSYQSQSTLKLFETRQSSEDCLLGHEITSIAPGQNKKPIPFFCDKYCEELSFPTLFPMGKYSYQVDRKVKLSPVKYVNARLLNYTG